MPIERTCPTCGRTLLIDEHNDSQAPRAPLAAARTIEVVLPATASTSDDGIDAPSLSLASPDPDPDPILGAIARGDTASPAPAPALPDDFPPVPASPDGVALADLSGSVSNDPISVLNFETAPAPRLESSSDDGVGEEVDEEEGARRRSWPFVLLASYASAMTLACVWLVLSGRGRLREPAPQTIPVDSRPDLGAQGGALPTGAPVPAPEADRITTIGQPIRVDSLEFTPLEVKAARVTLQHVAANGRTKTRDGGSKALRLRVRLKNLSKYDTFAPFDPAFIRERDRGLPESFVETDAGDRIDIFPLAQASEWSILGQSFPELGPGESAETIIVSAPDALDQASGSMTWRLRVRTDETRSDVLGVRFGREEIK